MQTYKINSSTHFTGNTRNIKIYCAKKIEQNSLSETNYSNLTGLKNSFPEENLSFEDLKKAARRNPLMIYQKPETLHYNIHEAAQRLAKYNLTESEYLKCAMKYSPLFSITPKTVINNIEKTAQNFKETVLTAEKLVNAGKKNPSIFAHKLRNFRKKVGNIVLNLNTVSVNDILEMFLKQPTQFSAKYTQIVEKYKLLQYIEENKAFDLKTKMPSPNQMKSVVLRKSFTNSMDLNYLILLRNKLHNSIGAKLPHKRIKENLINFLNENKNKKITFAVTDGIYAEKFIKFVKNFAKSNIGKNIFNIVIAK